MSVIQAKIQTVEDMYRLVRTAVVSKRPLRAIYHSRDRWVCPHRLGRNNDGRIRVLCYQYGGARGSGAKTARAPPQRRFCSLGEHSQTEGLRYSSAPPAPPLP